SIECILEPGEMLFIPAFWWHQVSSLDRLNVAVNFWWTANITEFFTAPQPRRFLVQKPLLFWAAALPAFLTKCAIAK
ncbi:MAG: cupin-like domain-containing protein, partial [Phormidium sp.]